MKDVVVNEIIKELGKNYKSKKKIITIMIDKCLELDYNLNESKEIILRFYK